MCYLNQLLFQTTTSRPRASEDQAERPFVYERRSDTDQRIVRARQRGGLGRVWPHTEAG